MPGDLATVIPEASCRRLLTGAASGGPSSRPHEGSGGQKKSRIRHLWLAVLVTGLFLFLLALRDQDAMAGTDGEGATLYFFWGVGCPHCEKAKPFVEELKRKHPGLKVESIEVLEKRENIPRLMEMARARNREATGVPVFIIGERMFGGFSGETAAEVEAAVRAELEPPPAAEAEPPSGQAPPLSVPLLGRVDPGTLSLPVFTVVIASLDSFNPCAFFVLFFLLSLLIHAHSRRRMLLIGGLFIFFSGLVYFLFMAAWLNLFLLTGGLPYVTAAAGGLALFVAAVNIKDFFLFERGISLSIPEQKKPKLFARMRSLMKADSLPSLLVGTTVLALAANSYELLCTAGFPMVFTRMLTLRQLSAGQYYAYLAFYCVIYIVPLAIIVTIFTVTLGARKLTEWQGRVLKLVSGLMMLGLGLVLLVDPSLLNNPLASALLLAGTLLLAALLILASRLKKS